MDSTVGTVIATVQPFGSRTLPPVGELRPTLKNFDCKFPLFQLFYKGFFTKKSKESHLIFVLQLKFSYICIWEQRKS